MLIHGVGGGVSTFAIQIAKLCGASRVFVTSSSAAKRARAKELGADEAIDYTATDVGKAVRELTGKRGVDVVVDSVGAATWKHSLTAAAKKGRIVTCGATSGPRSRREHQRHLLEAALDPRLHDGHGRGIHGDARGGRGRAASSPSSTRVFPLDDVRKAYERMASGEGFGKIVLKVSA